MAWAVSGTQITTAVGISAPTAAEITWAASCAAAVNAAITTRLNGYTAAVASAAESELARAAILDGAAAFRDLDSPHGVLNLGPDGAVVRTGSDVLRASIPAINRYALPGIG